MSVFPSRRRRGSSTGGRARFRKLAEDRLLPILRLEVEGEEVARALRLRERADEAAGRSFRAVALDERPEPVETAELDEGAEEVDAVGARELVLETVRAPREKKAHFTFCER